jgi:hypothetical protein
MGPVRLDLATFPKHPGYGVQAPREPTGYKVMRVFCPADRQREADLDTVQFSRRSANPNRR